MRDCLPLGKDTVLRMLTLLWQGAGADSGEQREHRTVTREVADQELLPQLVFKVWDH